MRHRRSSWFLLFSATGLIAGWNDVKIVPVFLDFDSLGRNVYPRKRKRNTLKLASSITIPTVYYLGFVRMQPQPDALQPISQRRPHLPGLALCHTVHYRIISEPLKFNGRELAPQPRIKRVVKVQISEYGGHAGALGGSAAPL